MVQATPDDHNTMKLRATHSAFTAGEASTTSCPRLAHSAAASRTAPMQSGCSATPGAAWVVTAMRSLPGIAVGPALERRVHEPVAGHGRHGFEHARIANATPLELRLDHPPSSDGEGIRTAGLEARRTRHGIRFHVSRSASARSSVRSSRMGVTETKPALTASKSVPAPTCHTASSPPIQ